MHNRGEDKRRSPHRVHCKVSVFYPYGKISVTYRSAVVGFLRISEFFLELFSIRCDWLIFHRLQADNSKFEFYPHTLTLTLTTETPINRAFQTDCEGVRVIK